MGYEKNTSTDKLPLTNPFQSGEAYLKVLTRPQTPSSTGATFRQ